MVIVTAMVIKPKLEILRELQNLICYSDCNALTFGLMKKNKVKACKSASS